jgi:hypothetical protein
MMKPSHTSGSKPNGLIHHKGSKMFTDSKQ